MPVYDCSDPKTIEEIWPSRVFDANGKEIAGVVWLNTDTGEVRRAITEDIHGKPIVNSAGEPCAVVNVELHPAPLRLEKITG